MDSFGDNFVNDLDVDPAAEFIAREQDQLAGLEVEIPLVATALSNTEDELTGTVKANSEDDGGSFEMINTIDQRSDILNENLTPPPSVPIKEEPEKIKKWREEQKARLEEKDAEEEKKKEDWRVAAKKELNDWYKHHTEAISKTKATNRNAEKQFVAEADDIEPGTEWERIAKLCDFNPKSSRTSKDVSKMRSIILQLKQNPPPSIKA
ncbi:PREDICTED: clathrin light chain isoform X2 [Ceratosolen solmsi marchali]|uniref:Clathrin light chain n=1 Tax=Ceratosolen solmsi marchali TaxID=326594 RepID=A0AAJ6YPJ1_9HYME|nr:PREDICTED: clathrin light chain isoform X2 [Ceratosolen solmsi marchali]